MREIDSFDLDLCKGSGLTKLLVNLRDGKENIYVPMDPVMETDGITT